MAFHQHTTGEEVVKACIARTEGKTFIITGTSEGGIGAATATALGHGKPKTIFLTGRNREKSASVIQEIQKIDSNINVIFVELDLSDQDSVRKAAAEVLASGQAETIDALINNAGVMLTMPFTKSKQDIELQFATNHVGHFLWTNLLLPRVLAAGPRARIVNIASTGYVLCDAMLDNYNWDDGKTYHPWLAYGSSKTANILFTTYLASHLKGRAEAFALQPGMPQTPLYKFTKPEGITSLGEAYKLVQEKYEGRPTLAGEYSTDEKTIETASSTVLVAAVDPEYDGKSGLFLRNCKPFETHPFATDPERAEKLWALSEKLVGEKFSI